MNEPDDHMPGTWLHVVEGDAPLVLSVPHSGIYLPSHITADVTSPWHATRDADWWVDHLYTLAAVGLGATVVRTDLSRTVIDVNRNPSGASLYPGRATTELCPTTDFDGVALYRPGREPSGSDVARRRALYFDPFHAALEEQIGRLRESHANVVIYDCHSIRSKIPRLFEGYLPVMNIGTHQGKSCAESLESVVKACCSASPFSSIANGRFQGGWITRSLGQPARGIHAVQMELACRGYLKEPVDAPSPDTWPPLFDEEFARPMCETLRQLLIRILDWAAPTPTFPSSRRDFI